jgi:hypothetical protein
VRENDTRSRVITGLRHCSQHSLTYEVSQVSTFFTGRSTCPAQSRFLPVDPSLPSRSVS